MRKKVKRFFLGLEQPNFLAMKLLLELFEAFEKDPCSKRIVDNISVLSTHNIKLSYSDEAFCYVDVFKDLDVFDLSITSFGTVEDTCHEFGHLLLEIFASGQIPEGFYKANEEFKKKILENKEIVSQLLRYYSEETFSKFMQDIDDPLSFYDRYPELKDEYFKAFPDSNEEEMIRERLEKHYAFISAFDNKICNYNKVSNIIDAIFCGDNPFFLDCGCEDIDCVLAVHNEDYFENSDFGPLVMSFGEQFSDYLVLRTFPEKFSESRRVLSNLLGDEWFLMMDAVYDEVTSRIGKRGKVYQHK